jgi:hypothetical protein
VQAPYDRDTLRASNAGCPIPCSLKGAIEGTFCDVVGSGISNSAPRQNSSLLTAAVTANASVRGTEHHGPAAGRIALFTAPVIASIRYRAFI